MTDSQLNEVASEIMRLDPAGERWARVFRRTYDMIYDGAETGRFRWSQLVKTEKTHFGTLFEINAQREFGFEGGDETDYRIAGHQVDAKWSQKSGQWMLPPEVVDEIALVATASDDRACYSLGLIRVEPKFRNAGENRDRKSTLNDAGKAAVRWLWVDEPMPANVLLQLPEATVDKIFDSRYGTERVRRLFRAAEGMLVHRNAVRTVAQQLDDQKRVRHNGGARTALQPEGYLILCGTWAYDAGLAGELGVPVPGRDHYVSVRVAPGGDEDVLIDGSRWRRADDPNVVVSAPNLPSRGAKED